MNCESCAKVIEHVVNRFPNAHLKHVDTAAERISIECAGESDLELIKAYIAQKGYEVEGFARIQKPAEGYRSDKNGLHHKARSVLTGVLKGEPAYALERQLLGYGILSFFLLLIFDLASYFAFFKSIPKFASAFAPLVALVALGTVANVTALFHFKSFRTSFSCMSGMMIGMTIGMISGFMLGAVVGAMNGMFIGSVVGMLGGMAAGAYAGRCCGVMGLMEGLMAGVMSGTMGAMLSVMLLADNLMSFLLILFIALIAILAGLSYMMYKEAHEAREPAKEYSFASFFGVCFVIAMAINWLILYGPKSGVFWTG